VLCSCCDLSNVS